MFRSLLTAVCAALFAMPALAQDGPEAAIDSAQKASIVRSLGEALTEHYVFPEVAEKTAQELLRRSQAGAYAEANTHAEFAERLNADLRQVGNDRHFVVRYRPQFRPHESDEAGKPTAEEMEQMGHEMAENGYGVRRTARLPGNIGYLDVRFFGPTEFAGPAFAAAMQLLSGSRAIIVDLRSNGGGDPDSVAQLASHFFAQGDERHLNSIYDRASDSTRDFWTVRSASPRFTGPVYLVTSDYTFSGGEEFAYDLQTQKRATLVGETTGGGANPGDVYPLGNGFIAFIPNGRAINPVTGKNWEHVGVVPDHKVAAEEALTVAYRMALKGAIAEESDPDITTELEELAAKEASAITELPKWKHPRE